MSMTQISTSCLLNLFKLSIHILVTFLFVGFVINTGIKTLVVFLLPVLFRIRSETYSRPSIKVLVFIVLDCFTNLLIPLSKRITYFK